MKITLCGSMQFRTKFDDAAIELSKGGHVVYSYIGWIEPGNLSERQKEIFDLVHLRKIMTSDAVVVLGRMEDGSFYIGDSTRQAIYWAKILGKRIYYDGQRSCQALFSQTIWQLPMSDPPKEEQQP